MIRRLAALSLTVALFFLAPRSLRGQEAVAGGEPDSVLAVGMKRVARAVVLQTAGLVPGRFTTYRDIQRAVRALYATGQYDDVRIDQDTTSGLQILIIRVHERPILTHWTVRGVSRLGEGAVRSKVSLSEGRPIDPAAVARARGRIDSLYRARGYYLADVKTLTVYEADSAQVRLVFDVTEGRRVAIARVRIDGNTHFSDGVIVGQMKSRPEGFWWWRKGDFDDEKLRGDMQERLPKWYGEHGYADFQILAFNVTYDDAKFEYSISISVSEGPRYTFGAIGVDSTIPGVTADSLARSIHIRSGQVFNALDLDPVTLEVGSDPTSLGLPAGTDLSDLSFDAMEVANGSRNEDFDKVFDDFLAMVAAGHPACATGSSDSHGASARARSSRANGCFSVETKCSRAGPPGCARSASHVARKFRPIPNPVSRMTNESRPAQRSRSALPARKTWRACSRPPSTEWKTSP